MGNSERVLKVSTPEALDQMKCMETPSGNHRWIHDGVIWSLPGQPEPDYPYFWKCLYCEMQIRTQQPLPKVEFEGNVLAGVRGERPEINRAIEQGD